MHIYMGLGSMTKKTFEYPCYSHGQHHRDNNESPLGLIMMD